MKKKLPRGLVVAVTLLALGTGAACQLIAGIDDDHFTVAPGDASVVDSAPGVDASIPDFCRHSLPPAPPPANSGSIAAANTYVVAVDEYKLNGRNDAGVSIGYDLDKVCTCFNAGPTAYDGGSSCIPRDGGSVTCDGEGGLDNGISPLFEILETIPGFGGVAQGQVNGIRCGKETMVLVISEYNGLANDGAITLGTIYSHGIVQTLDGTDAAPPDPTCGILSGVEGGTLPQKRDGTDVWSASASSLDSTSTKEKPIAAKTAAGYVTNYELVVTFDDTQRLAFSFAGSEIDITSGTLVAQLVPVDENNQPIPLGPDGNAKVTAHGFALVDGVFGGRVSAQDLVNTIGNTVIHQNDDGGGLVLECQSAAEFALISSNVCSSADIPSATNLDFQGQLCDGLSMMVPFHGSAAHLYGFREPFASGISCPDAGVLCGL